MCVDSNPKVHLCVYMRITYMLMLALIKDVFQMTFTILYDVKMYFSCEKKKSRYYLEGSARTSLKQNCTPNLEYCRIWLQALRTCLDPLGKSDVLTAKNKINIVKTIRTLI